MTRDVLVPFVATRAALVLVGWWSVLAWPRSPFVPAEWGVDGAHPLLQAFTRWDWEWYGRIAGEGYTAGAGQSATAFFPLFPLVARMLGSLFGATSPVGLAVAGVLVANAALIVALAYLVALVREELDAAAAARASLYVLVFPATLFLSVAYPESLFLALSVAAFYHARHGQWWLAGALGGLAALSRPHGVLILLPLAVEYVLQLREQAASSEAAGSARAGRVPDVLRRVRFDVLALALVPAAVAGWSAFLWLRFGDPLAFVHGHEGWGRTLVAPWETLARFFSAPLTLHTGNHSLVDFLFAALLVGLAVASWRVLRPSYAAWLTVLTLAVMSTGILLSMPRYAATFFPAFIVLAIAGRDVWFHRAFVVGSSAAAAVFMAMFAQWYWVG